MKKFTKIILIIAGSLAALGIVFSGIAAVMGAGWSTIHRKALAGELDFGNWHIGNGVYYAYDQGHGILDHFWDDDYDDEIPFGTNILFDCVNIENFKFRHLIIRFSVYHGRINDFML